MNMSVAEAAPATPDIHPARPKQRGVMRFLTCGGVDDGKSTLIGRLLYDTKVLLDDELRVLRHDSRKYGTTGQDLDFALLVDGLQAEREQGITIDVAYRLFATARRRFIVADAPGHEQYTRNMATAASSVDLAVVLVDARNGLTMQTRRHSFIASLLGIRHVVLAVNKIDLVDFDQKHFERICADYRRAAGALGFTTLSAIPLSARFGDNVTTGSKRCGWYGGPNLLEYLETIEVDDDAGVRPFRMPVQRVNRADAGFRGYSGTIAAGAIRRGDAVSVSGSGRTTTVHRIVGLGRDVTEAAAGDAVTLVLAQETDVSRGDVLSASAAPVAEVDQFQAHIVWLDDRPLMPGRSYLFKIGTRAVAGSVTRLRHRIDMNTHERLSADVLRLNDVGVVHLEFAAAVAYERYAESRELGGFIIIDRMTNGTVGVGMIDYALCRASNLHRQALDVDKAARGRLKHHNPAVVWFTGLSGAGKSTIANLVERKLHMLGCHTYLLDGDNVRHGLNRDLGFTEADRVENIRRVSEVATLFVDAGLIALVSMISPYRAEREAARERVVKGEFVEVFVDTPLEECRRRDVKGLYRRADQGLIRNLTGVQAPYERPTAPDLHLITADHSPAILADRVVEKLSQCGILR
jgi:bifunctional enzyme CysN/CysC